MKWGKMDTRFSNGDDHCDTPLAILVVDNVCYAEY